MDGFLLQDQFLLNGAGFSRKHKLPLLFWRNTQIWLQAFCQVVIHIIPFQLFLEGTQLRTSINQHVFDIRH